MDDARLTEIERLTNDVRAAEEGNNPGGQNPKVMALCIGVANLVAEVRDLTSRLAQSESRGSGLREEVESLTAKLASEQMERSDAERERDHWVDWNSVQARELSTLRARVAVLTKACADWEALSAFQSNSVTRLSGRLAELEAQQAKTAAIRPRGRAHGDYGLGWDAALDAVRESLGGGS